MLTNSAATFLRKQHRSLRLLPWISGGAGLAAVASTWLLPMISSPWRIGLNIGATLLAVICALAVQRRLTMASLEAQRVAVRLRDLKARSAADPAARAEYAEYLAGAIEMLRNTPRSRTMSKQEHAALVAAGVERLKAEQATLAQPPASQI